MSKDDFEAFWTAVSTGDLNMYSDSEMAFMDCDTNEDGTLDAAELDVKVFPPQCDAATEACPTENIGQYLLCQYNNNNPLEADTHENLYSDMMEGTISWDNCDCLPSDLAACDDGTDDGTDDGEDPIEPHNNAVTNQEEMNVWTDVQRVPNNLGPMCSFDIREHWHNGYHLWAGHDCEFYDLTFTLYV